MAKGKSKLYKTPEEFKAKAQEYFDLCENGVPMLDTDGNPVIGKVGIVYEVSPKPPNQAGMALYMGFSSKDGIRKYREYPEFKDVWAWCNLHIEAYNNERLYDREGVNGAKFTLTNNFGYSEKQDINIGGQPDNKFKVEIEIVDEA